VIDPDEQRWRRDVQAGRRQACAALVEAQYQSVYRFLLHLTRDVHLAEDLTQDTFAAAWQNAAAFEGRCALRTWLHRIAYGKFIDARRAGRRAAAAVARAGVNGAKHSAADPLDAVGEDDEARRLYAAVACLDPPDHTLIVLHYLQGLSYRDMAEVLAEPAGTVKWRTRQALDRLRRLLAPEVRHHE
jgi:RNA polymerase sigma-70 factor (ECF subfamily)